MADQSITIVLPSGGARTAEVPNDVPVRDLLTELVSLLELPTVGPDGRPMGYRMDSKSGKWIEFDKAFGVSISLSNGMARFEGMQVNKDGQAVRMGPLEYMDELGLDVVVDEKVF